jgi:hypothetical protein
MVAKGGKDKPWKSGHLVGGAHPTFYVLTGEIPLPFFPSRQGRGREMPSDR